MNNEHKNAARHERVNADAITSAHGLSVSSSFSRTQAVRDGLTRLAEVIGSNPASIAFLRMMEITAQLSRTFAHEPGSVCKHLDQERNSKAIGGRQSPSGSAFAKVFVREWSA